MIMNLQQLQQVLYKIALITDSDSNHVILNNKVKGRKMFLCNVVDNEFTLIGLMEKKYVA